MNSILNVIYEAVSMLFKLIEFMIFVRVLLSWIPMIDYRNPVSKVVYALTEPILGPVREMIRKSPIGSIGNMLDFSPIIAWLILDAILMILGTICYGNI